MFVKRRRRRKAGCPPGEDDVESERRSHTIAEFTETLERHPREHISTSRVERHNLTNAHSKKIENHEHAMALFFMFYNFCRVHSAIRTSPAAASGLADHVWTPDEFIGLLR